MKFIKRLFCLAFCLCLLPACGGKQGVLTVGELPISQSFYTYWISSAAAEWKAMPEEEKLTHPEGMQQWIANRAVDQCVTYAAVVQQYRKEGHTLSLAQKNAVSQGIGMNWSYYGDFLTQIGVKKTDYTKMFEYEEYRNTLFASLYDIGGSEEVSEEELKGFFDQNYLLFYSIVGYRTDVDADGNPVPLSEEQLQAQRDTFYTMAEKVQTGVLSLDQANYRYTKDPTLTDEEAAAFVVPAGQELSSNIIHKNNPSYPEGFFEQLQEVPKGSTQVLEFDAYLYLVQRLDLLTDETDYFSDYSQQCLHDLKQEAFAAKCEEWKGTLPLVRNNRQLKKISVDSILSHMAD